MTRDEIVRGVRVLANYYADAQGQPKALNDVQWAAYLSGLAPFTTAEFEAASTAWMRQSAFFPRLSDLLGLLLPPALAPEVLAHEAWATVERTARSVGAYRGVVFEDGALGETVRQVFGSWPAVCGFDVDSPGWAIRRQSFLALYPAALTRHGTHGPVTLPGLDRALSPRVIAAGRSVRALPVGDAAPAALSPSEAKNALGEIRDRFIGRGGSQRRAV